MAEQEQDITQLIETTPPFVGQEEMSEEERQKMALNMYMELKRDFNNAVFEARKQRDREVRAAEIALGPEREIVILPATSSRRIDW